MLLLGVFFGLFMRCIGDISVRSHSWVLSQFIMVFFCSSFFLVFNRISFRLIDFWSSFLGMFTCFRSAAKCLNCKMKLFYCVSEMLVLLPSTNSAPEQENTNSVQGFIFSRMILLHFTALRRYPLYYLHYYIPFPLSLLPPVHCFHRNYYYIIRCKEYVF